MNGGDHISSGWQPEEHSHQEVLASTPPGQLPSGKMDFLRTAVRFETASKKHDRLNRVQAIGIGKADTIAGTVSYDVYALK